MALKKGDRVMIMEGFCKGDNGRILDIWTGDLALVEVGGSGYVIPFDMLECYRVRGFERVSYAPKDTILPKRKTKHSAGYDFYLPCDVHIPAKGFSKIINTGVKAYMPAGEVLMLYIRSSIGLIKHVTLANNTGIIDSDYYNNKDNEGNIGLVLQNNGDQPVDFKKGERIMQGVFLNYGVIDDDNVTHERKGGIGSTNGMFDKE